MTRDDATRVLLVDDHPVVRSGLRALLDTVESIEVCGEAASGDEAIAMAASHQPDVVVMDLTLPGVDGIEATRRIVAHSPHVAVIILTMSDDGESVFAAMRAGARGYVLKGAGPSEVVAAIESVGRGEAIFGPGVATKVLGYFAAPKNTPTVPFPQLTDREREVLDLLARGSRNPDIARRLGISPKTTRNHISNILTKLAAADRADAIVRARDAGLGSGHTSRLDRDTRS